MKNISVGMNGMKVADIAVDVTDSVMNFLQD
jgi:hypothetical protein